MKKFVFITAAFVLFPALLQAQLLKDAQKLFGTKKTGFTEGEAAEGIRQALIKGTNESVGQVSLTDGYFGNAAIKIPFPEDARVVETRLRSMGLDKQVDEVILSLNRAAEDAARQAGPIFVDAIKAMSLEDAIGIVKGKEDAATAYLQQTTTPELRSEFQPAIKSSLDKVQATRYWHDLITTYNRIPLVQKINPDLPAYVTDMAIRGLFVMIAREEQKIRKDPMARTSEILRKVFGN
jgi:hypothetical protein